MTKLKKADVLPRVHEILRQRFGVLDLISGQGIAHGERVGLMREGKRVRCVIKTSSGGRISFGRSEGKWSGLDESDFVVVVAPTSRQGDDYMVSMFDQQTLKSAFDANEASQVAAGMGDLPNWIAPFHEEGRGPRGAGDGFGKNALWTQPLSAAPASVSLPRTVSTARLTIQEAKEQLSASLGVPVTAIEIIVRA